MPRRRLADWLALTACAGLALPLSLSLVRVTAADQLPDGTPREVLAPLADAPVAAPTAGATAAPAPAVATPSVLEGLEGLSDDDAVTRAAALGRLDRCTAADIPALEAALKNPDLDIRTHAGLILQRVKRGEVAVVITYTDGTPVAGVAFTGCLWRMVPEPESDREKKELRTKQRSASGTVQIEQLRGDFTTDAAGRLSLGAFADDDYRLQLDAPNTMPGQQLVQPLKLCFGFAPLTWQIERGIAVDVKVIDETGAPIADATVASLPDSNLVAQLTPDFPHSQVQQVLARQVVHGSSDAQGSAGLKNLLQQGRTLGVYAPGRDLAVVKLAEIADGHAGAVSVTLVKTKPVQAQVQCSFTGKGGFSNVRVLAVLYNHINDCLGNNWRVTASVDQIEGYTSKGAIDLGTTSETGELSATLPTDLYLFIAFPADSKDTRWAMVSVTSKSPSIKALFAQVRGGSFQGVRRMENANAVGPKD